MNLLLLKRDEIDAAGEAILDGRRAEHLRKVLKVVPGQVLRGGIMRGPRAHVEVTAVDPGGVRIRVTEVSESPPAPTLDLVVALPRPQALHRVLQFGAAMGVRRIDLTAAWRVEKSFFASPSLEPARIERHLWLGAEQGATTWVPSVAIHQRFLPFVASLSKRPAGVRLLAHPNAPLIEQAGSAALGDERIVVAIGPEGGWIDREVATFAEAGFVAVALGPWVLRVEAAVVAALAQIAQLRRTTGW